MIVVRKTDAQGGVFLKKLGIKKKVVKYSKRLSQSVESHKYSYIYFAMIGVLFLFTRLYKLTEIPNGMHIDEVSMGYNTWSLANFGTDKYNVSYPVYFNNAGSGQSALYVYVAVLIAKVFGYNLFTLRLVAVMFGMLLLIFGTMLSYELFGVRSSYITSGIITVMPIFINSDRFAFDCNAFIVVFTMFLYFTVRLIKTGKIKYSILLGISLSMCFYSYILSFLQLPILLVVGLVYCIVYKKISIKNILTALISTLIPSIPILLYVFVVLGYLPEMYIGSMSITDASYRRVVELGWQGIGVKEFVSNIATLTSYDSYNFVATEKYGVFYSIPLIGCTLSQFLLLISFCVVLGFCIYRFIKKEFNYEFLLIVSLVSILSSMFVTSDFTIYRYNAVFVIFALILSYTFDKLWSKDIRIPSVLIGVIYVVSFVGYIHYMFWGNYSVDCKQLAYFDGDLLSVCEGLNTDEYADYNIYIDNTTTYNAGLVALYGLRAEPSDVIAKAENLDFEDMVYENIHIGIPEDVDFSEKAVYIIRNLNAGANLYSDPNEPTAVYSKIVNNNNVMLILDSLNISRQEKNGYFVYVLN